MPKFVLRTAAQREWRLRFGDDDASYWRRHDQLMRAGFLVWMRLELLDNLWAVALKPVDGEVDLALQRWHQLHISIAFVGEVTEAEMEELGKVINNRLCRVRFKRFGSGGTGELHPAQWLAQALKPYHQRGWYSDRALHISF